MVTRIALAQISASEDKNININKAEAFMKKAEESSVNIICFPMLSFLRYFPQYNQESKYLDLAEKESGPTVGHFQNLTQQYGVVTIINVYEKDPNGQFFNATHVIGIDGSLLGKVQKMYLVEEPGFYEQYYYKQDDTNIPQVFTTKFGTIGVVNCYDRHFPEQMRAVTLKGADIIFTPQAITKDDPADLHLIEMQATSFQNQIFIGLVNRIGIDDKIEFSGGSFVTDPTGKIAAVAGIDKEELLITNCDLALIEKMRSKHPFLQFRRPELYDILQKRI